MFQLVNILNRILAVETKMSVEAVTDELEVKATLDDASGDFVASGEAIYTSELRGSDEAGNTIEIDEQRANFLSLFEYKKTLFC